MITSTVRIPQSVQTVWQALTEKEKMKQWYFDIPDFELKPGAVFNFYEPGGANLFLHRCVIQQVEVNQKISYTWTHPDKSQGESLVEWTLKEVDNAVEVTVEHSGIEAFKDAGPEFVPENYQLGWDGFTTILKNYCNGILSKDFSLEIQATQAQVWQALFEPENYSKWTAPINPGGYYQGELQNGHTVAFLNPEGSGIYSSVFLMDYPNQLIFQHLGSISDFTTLPMDPDNEIWSGSFEHYTLKPHQGSTELQVRIDVLPEYEDFLNETFSKALEILKTIAEDINQSQTK